MVAAGGEERGLRAERGHQAEAEHVPVERDGFRDRRDTQVDVAHVSAAGKPVERLRGGIVELAEEALDVERKGRQPLSDLALPELPRPVMVDLDPVPVRVAEVDRLADVVVGESDQGHAVARGVRQPAREVRALGHAQGEMEEAGEAVGRPRARLLDETEELGAVHTERCPAHAAVEDVQADRTLVVRDRPLEIGNG